MSLLLSLLLFTTGCRTVSKQHGMVTDAKLRSMDHEIWTRPTEIGFDLGKEIEGVAETTKFLGIFRIAGE